MSSDVECLTPPRKPRAIRAPPVLRPLTSPLAVIASLWRRLAEPLRALLPIDVVVQVGLLIYYLLLYNYLIWPHHLGPVSSPTTYD